MLKSALFVLLTIAPVSGQDVNGTKAFPTDSGVYLKSAQGEWNEIEPEIVNWKTGGVAKSAFSYGIVKGDMNGHIKGPTSVTRLAVNELLIVVPDGTSVTEYQLLHLREHSKDREFRAATGGVFHQSGGSDRDAIEFQHKKLASRTYSIEIPVSIQDGQYGILPPGAVSSKSATSIGKIYSFKLARQ